MNKQYLTRNVVYDYSIYIVIIILVHEDNCCSYIYILLQNEI